MEGPERNYTERTQHLRYDCNTLVDEVERDPHRVRPVQICDTTADDGLGGQIWRGGRWSLERWRGRFLESCTVTSLRSSWMEVVKLEKNPNKQFTHNTHNTNRIRTHTTTTTNATPHTHAVAQARHLQHGG